MQQAGEFGFLFQAEGTGKFFRQTGHRAEMVPEQLPTAFIRQPLALIILGGVGKVVHATARVLVTWRAFVRSSSVCEWQAIHPAPDDMFSSFTPGCLPRMVGQRPSYLIIYF